ncbi:MAG: hypothetical protein ACRDS0_41490 [Pseudonocardiaceae bacterium]
MLGIFAVAFGAMKFRPARLPTRSAALCPASTAVGSSPYLITPDRHYR